MCLLCLQSTKLAGDAIEGLPEVMSAIEWQLPGMPQVCPCMSVTHASSMLSLPGNKHPCHGSCSHSSHAFSCSLHTPPHARKASPTIKPAWQQATEAFAPAPTALTTRPPTAHPHTHDKNLHTCPKLSRRSAPCYAALRCRGWSQARPRPLLAMSSWAGTQAPWRSVKTWQVS